jgi:hypothetical protein
VWQVGERERERETGLMALVQCVYAHGTQYGEEEKEAEGWDAEVILWG